VASPSGRVGGDSGSTCVDGAGPANSCPGPRAMESYAVDIDPSQIVRWIKAEQERSPSMFRITATRSRQVRQIPVRQELHLGDEEREDLSEIATVGTLEVMPAHPADGWLLRIVVEDEAGPRIAAGETASAPEQQMDLGAFYHEFIRSRRGNADVTAETEGPEAKARLAHLLGMIERNRLF
jgi:hypothetical protein